MGHLICLDIILAAPYICLSIKISVEIIIDLIHRLRGLHGFSWAVGFSSLKLAAGQFITGFKNVQENQKEQLALIPYFSTPLEDALFQDTVSSRENNLPIDGK